MSKEFKFQLDDGLWEKFYRAFPGHGERSTLLRKIIRNIISLHLEVKPLHQIVAERVWEDIKETSDEDEEDLEEDF